MKWKRAGLAMFGTLVLFVAAAECALRWQPPATLQSFETREKKENHPLHPEKGIHQLDDALGYRPVLGGKKYNEWGTKPNEYSLQKPAGNARLLFIGDSVTRRAKIIEGLQSIYPGSHYEWWNGGVEGYNASQVSEYYRDYLNALSEDHVILTFHLNDYSVTPITFVDQGQMILVRSGMADVTIHPTLYHYSYLYRLYLGFKARGASANELFEAQEVAVKEALSLVQSEASRRSARLTVLILPWFAPPPWEPKNQQRYDSLLAILDDLGIQHFSFLTVLEDALAEGLGILDLVDDPKYRAHPSLEFGLRAARELEAQGFAP